MPKQPWHTKGYVKLAHVLVYLFNAYPVGTVDDAIRLVISLGGIIRKEMNGQATQG